MKKNNSIKEYAIQLSVETLCNYNILRKFMGRNNMYRKAERITDIYTNGKSPLYSGGFYIDNFSIAIYFGEDKLITKEDIESNSFLQETVIHEVTHAIFAHKKKNEDDENRDSNAFIAGTGMHIYRKENAEITEEYGKALNEGLTNWVMKKSGIDVSTYSDFTEIMEELEQCIGEKKVLEFTCGNFSLIKRNLKMNSKECMQFLGLCDEMYYTSDRIKELNKKLKFLENCKNTNSKNFAKKERIEEAMLSLNDELDMESEAYFSLLGMTQDIIVSKYVLKELRHMQGAKKIKLEDFERTKKCYNIVSDIYSMCAKSEELEILNGYVKRIEDKFGVKFKIPKKDSILINKKENLPVKKEKFSWLNWKVGNLKTPTLKPVEKSVGVSMDER